MIIDAILSVLVGVLKLIMTPLPSLPAISTTISDAGTWLINLVSNASGYLQAIYSAPLLAAVIALFVVLLAFEQIYWTVMWIVKKIPMLNIK